MGCHAAIALLLLDWILCKLSCYHITLHLVIGEDTIPAIVFVSLGGASVIVSLAQASALGHLLRVHVEVSVGLVSLSFNLGCLELLSCSL